MKNYLNLKIFLLIIIFFFLNNIGPVFSDKHKFEFIIINLGDISDSKYISGWLDPMNIDDISDWGMGMGLYLIEDKVPIVDNRARFVSNFGSCIEISGLKSYNKYSMWIDFVIFRNIISANLPARLEIFIDDNSVTILNVNTFTDDRNPYKIKIPYELTVDGSIKILFREHSSFGGFFGVWDVIISNKMKLPMKINSHKLKRNKMNVRNRILENRSGWERKSGLKRVR